MRRKLGVYKGQEGKVWNLMKVAWRQVGQEACVLDAGTLFLLPHCLLVLLLLLTVLNFSLSYGDLEERELSRFLPEIMQLTSLVPWFFRWSRKKRTWYPLFAHALNSLATVGYLLEVFFRLWIPFLVGISTSA